MFRQMTLQDPTVWPILSNVPLRVVTGDVPHPQHLGRKKPERIRLHGALYNQNRFLREESCRVPHISRFSRCGCPRPATPPDPPSSWGSAGLRNAKACQRRISALPPRKTKSNSCHPEQSEGSAALSIRKPGAPHLALFEMWVSGSEKMLRINHVL